MASADDFYFTSELFYETAHDGHTEAGATFTGGTGLGMATSDIKEVLKNGGIHTDAMISEADTDGVVMAGG